MNMRFKEFSFMRIASALLAFLLVIPYVSFSYALAADEVDDADSSPFDDIRKAALYCITELENITPADYANGSYTITVILKNKAIHGASKGNISSTIKELYTHVVMGYPYIISYSYSSSNYYSNYSPECTSLTVSYKLEKGESWWEKAYQTATEVAKTIEEQTTDKEQPADTLEQLRAIHQWLAENVTYRSSGKPAHTIEGVFITGKAACEGYAEAFKLLCDMLKIPCAFVLGNAGGAHAWNYAVVDGVAYHFDATWDDAGNNAYLKYFKLTHAEMKQHGKRTAPRTFTPYDYDEYASAYFSTPNDKPIPSRQTTKMNVDVDNEIIEGVSSSWMYATQVKGKKMSKIKRVPSKSIVSEGFCFTSFVKTKNITLWVGKNEDSLVPYEFMARPKFTDKIKVQKYDQYEAVIMGIPETGLQFKTTSKSNGDSAWLSTPEDNRFIVSSSKMALLVRISPDPDEYPYVTASKHKKINLSKISAAPKVKVDSNKKTVTVSTGCELFDGINWIPIRTKTLGIKDPVVEDDSMVVSGNSVISGKTISIRKASTNKKPASDIIKVSIP